MDVLKLGEKLKTKEPQVELDSTLKPGRYRVELVVQTVRGSSAPAVLLVTVTKPGVPTVPGRTLGPEPKLAPGPSSAPNILKRPPGG